MDTLRFIPRTTVDEQVNSDDPRNPCDCAATHGGLGVVFDSATSHHWQLVAPCAHVQWLIALRIIPHTGMTEASGFEVERKLKEFARNNPHLPRTALVVGMSGILPTPMLPERWPGCEWAGWGRWDGPGPKPRPMGPTYAYHLKHPLRPNETRDAWDINADPGDPPGTPYSITDTSRAAWPLPPLEP